MLTLIMIVVTLLAYYAWMAIAPDRFCCRPHWFLKIGIVIAMLLSTTYWGWTCQYWELLCAGVLITIGLEIGRNFPPTIRWLKRHHLMHREMR